MNFLPASPLPGTLLDPRYPDSDGRFMGDTDFHSLALIWLREALEDHFADQDVYVASNLIYYFQEGQPHSRRDPDVLVARGVGTHRRRSYRIWEEKVIPCTLFEIASRRTWRVDLGEKRQLYADLGIKEYFVFDPEARYVKPVLQGFRTRKQQSMPLKAAADGSVRSQELGVRLVPEGAMLRLIDGRTGQRIGTRSERAEQERERAEQEREQAERERRRAEQEHEQAERERRRAEQEREQAERERRSAEQERERADKLQAEVQRLRALLAKKERKR